MEWGEMPVFIIHGESYIFFSNWNFENKLDYIMYREIPFTGILTNGFIF
jgi:hypothetical protein